MNVETSDDTEDFFRILSDKVDEERYYTPKEISDWPEIQDLYSYLKSPAHKIGKILNTYKFKLSRTGNSRRYFL